MWTRQSYEGWDEREADKLDLIRYLRCIKSRRSYERYLTTVESYKLQQPEVDDIIEDLEERAMESYMAERYPSTNRKANHDRRIDESYAAAIIAKQKAREKRERDELLKKQKLEELRNRRYIEALFESMREVLNMYANQFDSFSYTIRWFGTPSDRMFLNSHNEKISAFITAYKSMTLEKLEDLYKRTPTSFSSMESEIEWMRTTYKALNDISIYILRRTDDYNGMIGMTISQVNSEHYDYIFADILLTSTVWKPCSRRPHRFDISELNLSKKADVSWLTVDVDEYEDRVEAASQAMFILTELCKFDKNGFVVGGIIGLPKLCLNAHALRCFVDYMISARGTVSTIIIGLKSNLLIDLVKLQNASGMLSEFFSDVKSLEYFDREEFDEDYACEICEITKEMRHLRGKSTIDNLVSRYTDYLQSWKNRLIWREY